MLVAAGGRREATGHQQTHQGPSTKENTFIYMAYGPWYSEVHVKSFWPKKLRKKNFFPFVFSHRFFFIAFLAVSLHEDSKNTINIFSKIRPEKLKKSQKR
jgi:hypothetical protein